MTAFPQGLYAEGDEWYARGARPEDNEALLGIVGGVPMGGLVSTVQDRAPDFFAWTRLHAGISETGVICRRRDDGPVGLGTSVVRPTALPDGTVAPAGYLYDMRVLPEWRGAKVVPAMLRGSLDRLRDVYGVDVCTAAVVDANAVAKRATTSRQPRRAEQPVGRPALSYDLVSVLAPRRRHGRGPLRAERASHDDLDDVAAFLAARPRTWCEPVDRKVLDERLHRWPGLTPASFLVVRREGEVVGCAAPWDASPVRRMRVHGYGGWLRHVRPLANALGRARGIRPLPPPGDVLRFATLSHFDVEGDDPEVFAALLDAAWETPASEGANFLAAMVPRGSLLARGFAGFPSMRVPMTLLAMAIPGTRWATAPLDAPRAGLEMAVA